MNDDECSVVKTFYLRNCFVRMLITSSALALGTRSKKCSTIKIQSLSVKYYSATHKCSSMQEYDVMHWLSNLVIIETITRWFDNSYHV